MSLNKRKCREFANPGLKLNLSNGLLHARQILFIVCTSIKVIDHHKTLILYIYPRERAAQGEMRPYMTVFQGRDDFITLSVTDDGGTKWRTAAFDDLGTDWGFARLCAFYTAKDEERVKNYLKSTDSGFNALAIAQYKIKEKWRIERQRIKESRILKRMSCIAPLPRGLKNWIHKFVMPAYFFYDYKRGGIDVKGVCSSCGKEIVLSGVKQGVKKICPHCGKELICKPRSRRGSCMYDRSTVQVIQKTGNRELVVRIVKVYYSYAGDMPKIQIYENARQFIYQNAVAAIHTESYYYSHGGILTDWRKGLRPVCYAYQYNFEADDCGYLFTKNFPEALTGTPWQYCPIDRFYDHFLEPIQSIPFLTAHLKHPRLEHLVKVGFYSIASDLSYRNSGECLEESKNRTHQILQVAAEDVDFLRDMDVDLPTLQVFQEYAGLKGRQELLLWQLEHKVSRDIMPILQHMNMNAHKFMHYMDDQLRRAIGGSTRYQDLVSLFRDYLEMSEKLGYIKNSFVLYPKDLQKAHDKAARQQKQKADAKLRRDFNAAYREIAGKFDYEYNGLKIVYPDSPNAVIKEGQKLHHCVGSYLDRIAKRECIILFLRQCDAPSNPFFTVELRDWKIVQVRGMKNCDATPEVQEFISAWEKRVLSRIDTAA